jgi:predicted nucleic acid-binding protein
MRRLIVDTGPLVALLNTSDAHHAWTRGVLEKVEPPLVTCEAVISEACFLLRRVHGGPDAVLDLVQRGAVNVSFSLATETGPVRKLMARYAGVPMSLADACLVRMVELDDDAAVLTLDSDFAIYRRNRRNVIPTIRPS